MRRVDAFLSRKAQQVWPTATVACDELPENRQSWVLVLVGPKGSLETNLGPNFRDARQALEVMRNAEIALRALAAMPDVAALLDRWGFDLMDENFARCRRCGKSDCPLDVQPRPGLKEVSIGCTKCGTDHHDRLPL